MEIALWVLAYMVVGTVIMLFIWSNNGHDLTVGDALFGLIFAALWPVVVGVIAIKFAHEYKIMSIVIWKRK